MPMTQDGVPHTIWWAQGQRKERRAQHKRHVLQRYCRERSVWSSAFFFALIHLMLTLIIYIHWYWYFPILCWYSPIVDVDPLIKVFDSLMILTWNHYWFDIWSVDVDIFSIDIKYFSIDINLKSIDVGESIDVEMNPSLILTLILIRWYILMMWIIIDVDVNASLIARQGRRPRAGGGRDEQTSRAGRGSEEKVSTHHTINNCNIIYALEAPYHTAKICPFPSPLHLQLQLQ